ncbi:MAG: hypothetical protein IT210_12785 [Armatimonadetes bacterium]|nr:hypothetical protein [Armatimonadota bacterium]
MFSWILLVLATNGFHRTSPLDLAIAGGLFAGVMGLSRFAFWKHMRKHRQKMRDLLDRLEAAISRKEASGP